jgi:hypothetical protein
MCFAADPSPQRARSARANRYALLHSVPDLDGHAIGCGNGAGGTAAPAGPACPKGQTTDPLC